MRPEADGPDWGHPPSLHRSDADISPATDALRPQQLSAPASITKTQITQHGITVPVAPTVLKTTVAALAQPSLPIKSQKSHQTPALNLHSLTPPPVRTPPRFPPSRLFGRLPPRLPSRLRLAGIRKPLNDGRLPPRLPSRLRLAGIRKPLNDKPLNDKTLNDSGHSTVMQATSSMQL